MQIGQGFPLQREEGTEKERAEILWNTVGTGRIEFALAVERETVSLVLDGSWSCSWLRVSVNGDR